MTEISRPWNGTTVGDAGPYSDQNWADAWSNMLGAVNANSGPLRLTNTPPEDTLEVTATSPVSAGVTLSPGAALVDGTLYMNDADLTLSLTANGSGNPRFDLVVLQKDFTLQTVRAVVKQGTPAASPSPPGLTQTAGVMWEIPIADIFLASGYVSVVDDNITPRHEYANAADGVILDGVLNNSGGNLLTGDVVVWDSSTDRAVTSTTTEGNPNVAGVWVGRKSNALYGRVRRNGIGLIRTNATVTRGQLLATSTTAKQAKPNHYRNFFARTLAARAGSGLVLAELFPPEPSLSFVELYRTVLTGSAASIDLQTIPPDYHVLWIACELRTDRAATTDDLSLRFNNDSGANYYSQTGIMPETGTWAMTNSLGGTSLRINTSIAGATAVAGYRGVLNIYIYDYASAARVRVMQAMGYLQHSNSGAGSLRSVLAGGLWTNAAAAINQITLLPVTGPNFVTGSIMAVYGAGVAV